MVLGHYFNFNSTYFIWQSLFTFGKILLKYLAKNKNTFHPFPPTDKKTFTAQTNISSSESQQLEPE